MTGLFMSDFDHITSVEFRRFKAFESFTLELRHFNVMTGPNNAGKSTIITAFRILAHALRRAESKKAEMVRGPNGLVSGYKVDIAQISVSDENIFYNYSDETPASITFRLSTGCSFLLYFPEREACLFIPDAGGRDCSSPKRFSQAFKCSIGFVPILGPVEHDEPLYEKEAARLARFNVRAARNFRNIWYHYPEDFDDFRKLVQQTWPGMDVSLPESELVPGKPLLRMYCPEKRIPREICWSGFGFQVWCQMLTFIVKSRGVSLFIIDEPDIYLHSDLQRQLVHILKELGPDIILATHSAEIMMESELDDIMVIDKERRKSKRVRDSNQLIDVFKGLGSNANPILTQVAKTRKVLFVEGEDYQVIGRLAAKMRMPRVANRSAFAVIPVKGFNPERVRTLKYGMEATLGDGIEAMVIFDRDYRCAKECEHISEELSKICSDVIIMNCKEIENLLLIPDALDRAIEVRLKDKAKRGGENIPFFPIAGDVISNFSSSRRHYILGQFVEARKRFEREMKSGISDATLTEQESKDFEDRWAKYSSRMEMIPGKEALAFLNSECQNIYRVSITIHTIIDSMLLSEVPEVFQQIARRLTKFAGL